MRSRSSPGAAACIVVLSQNFSGERESRYCAPTSARALKCSNSKTAYAFRTLEVAKNVI